MIELRPLSNIHISPFYKWINDPEVIKYSLSLFLKIHTENDIEKWYKGLIENEEILNFGIFIKENNKLIGYTGIGNISKTNKSGEFYIFIGEKKMWGKGIGTLATKQLLKIGFSEQQLNSIFLTVSEPNIGGIKAYENAGFKHEGRLRQACYRDHEFHDKLIMSILKSEYQKQKTTEISGE
ncbi:MAG: GNAT family N-acetyltransferase [Flavobacteriaceae bacterium]|nr:GNAT family N-acetyltransferase [Flavobacteriaceae bacterium]